MTSPKSRSAAIALFVAGAAILAGIVTHSWFRARRHDSGIGLTGVKECRGAVCRSMSWGELGGDIPGDLTGFGYLGFIAGLGSVAACAAGGGLLLRRQGARLPLKVVRGVLVSAAFGQLAFTSRVFATGELKGLSVGWSTFVALGGLLAAGVIMKTMVVPAIAAETGAALPPPPAPQPYTIA